MTKLRERTSMARRLTLLPFAKVKEVQQERITEDSTAIIVEKAEEVMVQNETKEINLLTIKGDS